MQTQLSSGITGIAAAERAARSMVTTGQAPGVAWLAVGADGVRHEVHEGSADLATGRPVSPDTTFMAYSMSKTVTAVAVLQLVEQGRLDLNTRVADILPHQPYGPDVTVRQLLAHTGGLPNPIPLRWVHLTGEHERFDERAALDAVLWANPRLSSRPGTRFRYSNIGYWLLGAIVEQVTGRPFVEQVRQAVIAPLGLGPTDLGYAIPDPARHASGYLEKFSFINAIKGFVLDRAFVGEYHGRWLTIRPHYLNGPAFGGLVGTARGFGRFLQDQLQPPGGSALIGDAMRTLLATPQRVTNGSASTVVPMTPGWHVGALDGTRVLFKEGGGGGFHLLMRLYPERGLGTVLLTNATVLNVTRALDAIDRALSA